MHRMKAVGIGIALCAAAPLIGWPQEGNAAQPISGAECMSLNLSDAQMANNSVQIPILAGPSGTAPRVASAASVVLAISPAHDVSGYTEVLRINGRHGWIASSHLKPWHSLDGSDESCVPAKMSNGRYGFVTRK
jgi:hypothetical protein